MEATQQQSFPFTDARVISTAAPPNYRAVQTPSKVLAAAAFLGVMLGFGAGILREAVDRVSVPGTKSKRYWEPTVLLYCRA